MADKPDGFWLTVGDMPTEFTHRAPDDAIVAAVVAKIERMCNVDSPRRLPPIAARVNKREFYRCGLDKGHDGPHRWPEDGSIIEWHDTEETN